MPAPRPRTGISSAGRPSGSGSSGSTGPARNRHAPGSVSANHIPRPSHRSAALKGSGRCRAGPGAASAARTSSGRTTPPAGNTETPPPTGTPVSEVAPTPRSRTNAHRWTEALRNAPSAPRSRATDSCVPRSASGSSSRPPGASCAIHSGRTSPLPTVRMIRSYGAPGAWPSAPSPHTSSTSRDPGGREVARGTVDELLVDVDGDHVALRTDDPRHERGVVAGAGADLENAVARAQVELREHDRHHRRLGGRARRDAVDGLHRHGLVGIGAGERYPGQEQVPRHRPERLLDGRAAQPPAVVQPVDEPRAGPIGRTHAPSLEGGPASRHFSTGCAR